MKLSKYPYWSTVIENQLTMIRKVGLDISNWAESKDGGDVRQGVGSSSHNRGNFNYRSTNQSFWWWLMVWNSKGWCGEQTQVTAWPNLGENKVNHCGFTARVAASLISLLSIFWRWWWRRNDRLCLRVWSVPYVASNVVGNGSGRQVGFWVRLGFKSSFSPSLSRVHSLSLK